MPEHMTRESFVEAQRFVSRGLAAILSIICACVVVVVALLALGEPGPVPSLGRLPLVLALTAAVAVPILFHRLELTVVVGEDTLDIRFPPLVRRRIPLTEIVECEVRTYRPIREYGGWGVRCGRRGRAYNVKGNRGVQLTLASGEGILIGSQRPEQLSRALHDALDRRRGVTP